MKRDDASNIWSFAVGDTRRNNRHDGLANKQTVLVYCLSQSNPPIRIHSYTTFTWRIKYRENSFAFRRRLTRVLKDNEAPDAGSPGVVNTNHTGIPFSSLPFHVTKTLTVSLTPPLVLLWTDFIDDPDTYDCPEEILKGKNKTSTPLPVYYVVDDPYPDSVSNTFGADVRGRPDGHVYDEPGRDISRRDEYVVMQSPAGMSLSSADSVWI